MGMMDWIARQWREWKEPGREELNTLSRQLNRACALNDFGALAELFKKYRHSDFTAKLIGVKMMKNIYPMIFTPNDAVRDDVLAMMESLRKTRSVQASGDRLTEIPSNTHNPLHDILAMHTFMLDAALSKYSHSGILRPEPMEVQAAVRILDEWHKKDYASELVDLIHHHQYPSEYLALRFGWEKEYTHAKWLESILERVTDMDGICDIQSLNEDRENLYTHWERKAEAVLENLEGVTLPERYLTKLDAELRQLAALARFPETIDSKFTCRSLLHKYDIHPIARHDEKLQQVERAFRGLDKRLSHLTGRPAQADKLFSSIKTNHPVNDFQREVTRSSRPFHKKPKKGRKPSL